jgi:transforming growth factor-beta-induced protein
MKTLKLNTRIFTLTAIVGLAIFTISCTKDEAVNPSLVNGTEATKKGNGAPAPGDMSIAALATGTYDSLVSALVYVDSELSTGLVDLFSTGTDQYTVFAPTDAAFIALLDEYSVGSIRELGDDVLGAETIRDVLYYHVTEGRRAANSVIPKNNPRTIETLLMVDFTVDSDAMITAVGNTAQINAAMANISASNGIIHEIDTVILPL